MRRASELTAIGQLGPAQRCLLRMNSTIPLIVNHCVGMERVVQV
jgi:hypothetical protein